MIIIIVITIIIQAMMIIIIIIVIGASEHAWSICRSPYMQAMCLRGANIRMKSLLGWLETKLAQNTLNYNKT